MPLTVFHWNHKWPNNPFQTEKWEQLCFVEILLFVAPHGDALACFLIDVIQQVPESVNVNSASQETKETTVDSWVRHDQSVPLKIKWSLKASTFSLLGLKWLFLVMCNFFRCYGWGCLSPPPSLNPDRFELLISPAVSVSVSVCKSLVSVVPSQILPSPSWFSCVSGHASMVAPEVQITTTNPSMQKHIQDHNDS